MELTLAEQFDAYRAKYSEQVRDLAETFCANTTRLSVGAEAVQVSPEDVRLMARRHEVDYDTLSAAVADYAAFELRAEAEHRRRGGKLSE